MRKLRNGVLCAALVVATACQADPGPAEASHEVDADAAAHQVGDAGAAAGHDAHESDLEPQPLLPIMMGMSADMTALTQALWLEDYTMLSERARHLAGHVAISDDELARIRSVLGPDMAAFEAADEAVHEAAVRMSRAADARDTDQLLSELATVQRGCVACHAQFRSRLSTTGR